jgi:hypothetical protein
MRAAETLDLKEVPTIRLEHLTEAQAKAFMIADNRSSETSEWNEQLLAESLRELCDLELDFSIEATGFEMGEIDLKIESLVGGANDPDEEADAVPSPATGPAVSQPGDVWPQRTSDSLWQCARHPGLRSPDGRKARHHGFLRSAVQR